MHYRLRHRALMLSTLVLFAGLAAFACGGSKEAKPEKLVPEGVNLIGSIQVEEFLNDADLDSIFQALPMDEGGPQSTDQFLDEALVQTGIDFKEVSHASFFGDVSRLKKYAGVIIQGKFDEDAIIAVLQNNEEQPLVVTDYKGRLVHTAAEDHDQRALVVLGGDILVVGTREAVRAVIDVQDGDRDRASQEVRDALSDLGGGLVRLVVEVPAGALEDQLPLRDVPFLGGSVESLPAVLGVIQDLVLAGLAVDQDGQNLKLRAVLNFNSADSATAFGDFLAGILKLAAGFSPDAQTTELLNQLRVDADGTKVEISLEVAVSELSRLLGGLLGVSSVESSAPAIPVTPVVERAFRMVVMPTANHVPDGRSVAYNTTPPTSGDHWTGWADGGFHEEGLPDELIVHNLEHGKLVVSYNLAADEDVERLRSVMDSLGLAAVWGVTRPYDKIPEGTVALAA